MFPLVLDQSPVFVRRIIGSQLWLNFVIINIMAAIRLTGMASGLPPNIVEQLMDVERIPVKQMETKKTAEDEKYKLVEDLENKINEIPKSVSELVGIKGFTNVKFISGSPDIINGVVDPTKSVAGTWMVEVLQLATKAGAMSSGFPDADQTRIGTGYIKFDTSEGTKEVYVSRSNSTLKEVAAAINSAGIGVQASVINDRKDKENPYRLLVTGISTGTDKQVKFPNVYLLDGDEDFSFHEEKTGQNAKIKVDGFEMEAPENQVKDVIPGVVLELKQAVPGRPVSISTKEDLEVISGKIKSFVDAYNGVLSWIQNQHKLQKGKDGKERLGPMGGDGLLRTIEGRLRQAILNPQQNLLSPYFRLAELGVEFNRSGTLTLNQEKFNKILSSDPSGVAAFFKGDGLKTGFVTSIKSEVSNLINGSIGPVSMRKRSMQDKIKQLDQRIDQKNRLLEKREDSLKKKFADLESQMSKLNQQGGQVSALGALAQGAKNGG